MVKIRKLSEFYCNNIFCIYCIKFRIIIVCWKFSTQVTISIRINRVRKFV